MINLWFAVSCIQLSYEVRDYTGKDKLMRLWSSDLLPWSQLCSQFVENAQYVVSQFQVSRLYRRYCTRVCISGVSAKAIKSSG